MGKVLCPCCHAEIERKSIYRVDSCPAMNNVTYCTRQEATAAAVGSIELVACHRCGVVFNCVFDAPSMNYDGEYDNSRSASRVYLEYLDVLTTKVAEGVCRQSCVLEVGCGNGDFLKMLCDRKGVPGYGYDTAYSGDTRRGTVTFSQEPFVPTASPRQHDVFVLRHVLEHIGSPYRFLRDLCRPGVLATGARIFIETPDLEWIVNHGAYYDVTYEHCNYFTRESLAALAISLGFESTRTFSVFGGQYLLLEAVYAGGVAGTPVCPAGPDRPDLSEAFSAPRRRFYDIVRGADNVCVWGASGKGVNFLSTLDTFLLPKIGYVVDINRNKQGRFLPGSAKCIEAPEALKQVQGCVDVLIMNEVYSNEIQLSLREMGIIFRSHVC